MYEPIHAPILSQTLGPIPQASFGITYTNRPINSSEKTDPLHIHSYIEIFFNLSTEVSFLVNNRIYSVPAGSVVISKKNDVHVCFFNKPDVYEYFVLWIDTDTSSPLLSFLGSIGNSPLLELDNRAKNELSSEMFFLFNETADSMNAVERAAALLRILRLLKSAEAPRNTDMAVYPTELKKILDDIKQNYASLKNVNDLAERHFVSPATLNRRFRKYLGLSPREYIEAKKLSASAELLSSGVSVTEACMKCGFSDCSYFIALFKKKFGKTPLKYKNEALKNK